MKPRFKPNDVVILKSNSKIPLKPLPGTKGVVKFLYDTPNPGDNSNIYVIIWDGDTKSHGYYADRDLEPLTEPLGIFFNLIGATE